MHLILDPRSDSSDKRHKSRYLNKGIIIGIVSSIIAVIIIAIILFIIIRYRCKHKNNASGSPPIPPRLFVSFF